MVVHSVNEIAALEKVEKPISAVHDMPTQEPSQEILDLLRELVNKSGKELDATQKEEFYHLLLEFREIFAATSAELGCTDKFKHNIYTGKAPPVRQQVCCIPPSRRSEVKQVVQDMLQRRVIQESSSPWASPIVLAKKKDGSTRFCVDYRRLNEVTRKDAYPLPRIDMTFDMLAGSQWFSTVDLLSGYWQVEKTEEARHKTVFCTTEGLYEFNVLLFGLCNAPATFQ